MGFHTLEMAYPPYLALGKVKVSFLVCGARYARFFQQT